MSITEEYITTSEAAALIGCVEEISLADFGLETVADACARKGWAAKTVQNWIKSELLPAVQVGGGRGTLLVRIADVDAFTPPPRGRPTKTPKTPPCPPDPAPKKKWRKKL